VDQEELACRLSRLKCAEGLAHLSNREAATDVDLQSTSSEPAEQVLGAAAEFLDGSRIVHN
jgi:hypothetical protein